MSNFYVSAQKNNRLNRTFTLFKAGRFLRLPVLSLFGCVVLCLSACNSLASSSQTQALVEQNVNGFGTAANHVHAMLVLPTQSVLLATHYGLYRSINDGKSWSGPNATMSNMMASSLSSSPLDQQHIYVLAEHSLTTQTGGIGLYTSADGGVTWKFTSPATKTGKMYTVVAGNRSANEVYAYVPTKGAQGLLVSQDGGANFSSPGALPFGRILGILPLPAEPGQVLVYSNDGVARSSDGGAHWQVINSFSAAVYNMSVSGNSSTIYASGDQGIFVSHDAGKRFTLVDENDHYSALTAVSGQIQTVYGKTGRLIYKSVNGGSTWKALPSLQGNLENLVPNPQVPSQLFLSLSYPSGVEVYNAQSGSWSSLTPKA
jgi:photosystem II stability/assembly factor-like uncharacterized protein